MSDSAEQGFDNPERQEHILNLLDRGYAVYFGKLATAAEADAEYYALVISKYDHAAELHMVNEAREDDFLDMCEQAYLHTRRVTTEEYQPLIRLTENYVLCHPDIRISSEPRDVLIEAIKASRDQDYSQRVPRTGRLQPPARLRQAHTDCPGLHDHRRR